MFWLSKNFFVLMRLGTPCYYLFACITVSAIKTADTALIGDIITSPISRNDKRNAFKRQSPIPVALT